MQEAEVLGRVKVGPDEEHDVDEGAELPIKQDVAREPDAMHVLLIGQ